MATVFWGLDRFHALEWLSYFTPFNNQYLCNVFFWYWTKTCKDFPSITNISHRWFRRAMPIHINPHTATSSVQKQERHDFEQMPQPWDSSDLSPSDIFSLGCLNNCLVDRQYEIEDELLAQWKMVTRTISRDVRIKVFKEWIESSPTSRVTKKYLTPAYLSQDWELSIAE
jgi:hypothetical protein